MAPFKNLVYLHSNVTLSLEDYVAILTNPDKEKCITDPPVKPSPGELFVYINKQKPLDWRSDQYVWRNKGCGHIPRSCPTVTVTYFDVPQTNFKKRSVILYAGGSTCSDVTIVHYLGSNDGVNDRPHGNRKRNLEIPYFMSAKSVIAEQKTLLTTPPSKTYKRQVCREVHPAVAPVMLPRDMKQVCNAVHAERGRKVVSKDDIVGIYMLNSDTDFIQEFRLLPSFFVVLYTQDSMATFFSDSCCFKSTTVLQYDTTFQLGDFYLSVLSYTHNMFINKCSQAQPIVPLAYLIHTEKTEFIHLAFFDHLVSKHPDINTFKNVIVTDREKAITNSIHKAWPQVQQFFCWNHIRRDVRFWVQAHKGNKADQEVYSNHIADLLDTAESDFTEKLEKMKKHWSKPFLSYFDKHILTDLKSTAKWELEKRDVYLQGSGITTNRAESFNAVIKRLIDYNEVKGQVMVLTLYHLDICYRKDIVRGKCRQGNFVLVDPYLGFALSADEVDFPESRINLDNLPYVLTNRDLQLPQPEPEQPFTNFSAAKRLVLEGKVKHVPEEQLFIVSTEKKKFLVTIFPKEECSCNTKGGCHHVQAVRISLGDEKQNHKKVKLSRLMKSGRPKAGRKKGPQQLNIVEAVSHTNLTKGSKSATGEISLLVPTVVSPKGLLKKRFIDARPHTALNFSPPTLATSTPLRSPEMSRDVSSRAKPDQRPVTSLGITIYEANLQCLTQHSGSSSSDLHLWDCVIEMFLRSVAKKAEHNTVLKIMVGEAILLSGYTDSALGFLTGYKIFISNEMMLNDILLLPIVENHHCQLMVAVRSKSTVYFLDSLPTPDDIVKRYASRFLKLVRAFSMYIGNTSSDDNWDFIVPSDVNLQRNTFDCGVFTCMFGEAIVSQKLLVDADFTSQSLTKYRSTIRRILQDNINNPQPSRPVADVDHSKVERIGFFKGNFDIHINRIDAVEGSTFAFLSTMCQNHWDELTDGLCVKGKNCIALGAEMILCEKCDHWVHKQCDGVSLDVTLPGDYICERCRSQS